MKRKSIFKVVLMTLIFAFAMPVAVLFAGCDQNPPKPCEVVFVIDGRKEKSEEIAIHSSFSPQQANELFGETKTGYTLDGWYTDSARTHVFEGVSDAKDKIVLYGIYVKNSYTLTFVLDNGESNLVYSKKYEEAIEAPVSPDKVGYGFAGWDKPIPETMPAEDVTITALWSIHSHNIRFEFGNGDDDYEDILEFGTPIVKPADPSMTGYSFAGWTPSVPETMPDDDVVFEAIWHINQYTISFDTDGGSAVADIKQDYDSVITPPANPTKTGYEFNGWDTDIPERMPAGNMTITATWSVKSYEVTFVLNNDTEDVVTSFDFGHEIEAPIGFEKTGYTFTGWSPELPDTMPAEDITVYAQWTINEYTITFMTDGGSHVNPICQEYGTAITPPANPTKTGYAFVDWDAEIPETMPDHDMMINAIWSINSYTISFETDGGSEVASIEQNYNTEITAPDAPTKTGYTFGGWLPEVPSKMPAENMTCVAQWNINTYSLTFNMLGVVANVVRNYNYGASVEAAPIPSHDGYTFGGYDIALPEIMPDHDVTLTAIWEPKQFSVTYVLGNGEGNIVDYYFYDTDITAPANPTRAGYTFDGWDEDIPTTMPAENLIITAEWQPINITITFDSKGGSAVPSITELCGVEVAAPANPTLANNIFGGWFTDDGSFNNEFVFPHEMPTADLTLYAKWTAVGQYQITFMVDGVQYHQITDYAGASVTLPAEPTKDGFTFAAWSPSVPATMPSSDLEVEATWNKIQYSLTILNFDDSVYYAGNYETNAEITTPAGPARNYYTFDYWLVCDTSTGFWQSMIGAHLQANTSTAEIQSTVYGNLVLKAVYHATEYTITFDANGGNAVASINYTTETATFDLPTATRPGYSFDGWFDSGDNEYTQIPQGSHGDLALTASWDLDTYTITYHLDDGTNNVNNPSQYTYESALINLENPTKAHYTFGGWYTESGFENAITQIAQHSTGDVEVWAKWTINSHDVTFDLDNGSAPIVESFEYGAPIVAPTGFEKTGYTFTGWNPTIPATMPDDDNLIYTAQWQINQYTMTFALNNDLANETITDDYGTDISTKADPTPKAGYTFAGWCSDSGLTTPYTLTTMPAENKTVYAKYTLNEEMRMFTFTSSNSLDSNQNIVRNCQITGINTLEVDKEDVSEIYVPDYVTGITQGAFGGCPNVEILRLPFTGQSRTTTSEAGGFWANSFRIGATTNPDEDVYLTVRSNCYVPKTLTTLILSKDVVIASTSAFSAGINTTLETIIYEGTIADWCAVNINAIGRSPVYQPKCTYDTDPDNPDYTYQSFYYTPDPEHNPAQYEKLTELVTPNSVDTISDFTFAKFPITKLTITSNIKIINANAFKDCVNLQDIVINYGAFFAGTNKNNRPAASAFDGCTGITHVFLEISAENYDTKDDNAYKKYTLKEQIANIVANDKPITESKLYFKYTTIPTTSGNYWTNNEFNQIETLVLRSITFVSNGGSDVATIVAEVGTALSAPAEPTQTGYTFDGWYEDDGVWAKPFTFSIMPAEDKILYAKWTAE